MESILKYPRTPHLEGSRLQAGDRDLSQIKFTEIANQPLVVEEKVDGANCGISFDKDGNLRLQSRGHYLNGGSREKHFALLKQWASEHQIELYDRLGSRYLMYGEWMYAKHTIFYNQLPHYFLEFDIFDCQENSFLDTTCRRRLLQGSTICSIPVLYAGTAKHVSEIHRLVGPSRFISASAYPEFVELADQQKSYSLIRETDLSGLMEGLYIKVERDGRVVDRLKFVRSGFLSVVDQSGSHWNTRPIVRNRIDPRSNFLGNASSK